MAGGGIRRVKLGSQGLEVSGVGFGSMGMSAYYGYPKPEPEMIKVIHHAINSGITMIDTADCYGPKINEILVGKALKEGGMREKVELSTKFGITPVGLMEVCGKPEYVRSCCEESLERLQVDCIDLYYIHRIDTTVPIEITVSIEIIHLARFIFMFFLIMILFVRWES